MSQLCVIKFGGTSVADFERMSKCAAIVRQESRPKVVVVSAIANTTRLLLQSLTEPHVIHEIEKRHYAILNALKIPALIKDKLDLLLGQIRAKQPIAKLLALGEQISSLLFTALLNEQGIDAINFDVRKVLKTNSNFLKAEPDIKEIKTNCEKFLLPLCNQQTIVTQGFIGRDKAGATTILGMESSDYTAALLAEALEADHFAIWTDVPGILTLDPKITSQAQPISELSFNEAAELSIFGAKILHPATLQPAIRSNIKFCVGCSQDPQHKTWVSNEAEDGAETLRAMSLRKNQILLTVKDISNTHTRNFLAALFNVFAKHNIDLDLVVSNNISAQVVIDDNQKQLTEGSLLTAELINELTNIGQVIVERNLSLIALIGKNIQKHQQVEHSLFDFLKTNNIRSVFYGVSSHSICFLLNSLIAEDAVKQLHDILFKFEREK